MNNMNEKTKTEQLNKQLWKEKMHALKESKGDLGELVRKTPGASAKVIRRNGDEEVIAKGSEVDEHGLKKRGYKEHR